MFVKLCMVHLSSLLSDHFSVINYIFFNSYFKFVLILIFLFWFSVYIQMLLIQNEVFTVVGAGGKTIKNK